MKRATDSGISESSLVGWLYGIWGEVLAELNQVDEALEKAEMGVELANLDRDIMHIASTNLCLVRVLFSSGDVTGAENIIQSLEKSASNYDLPLQAALQFSAWQARIWLVQEKLEDVSKWVEERKLVPGVEPTYLHEMENIVFARFLIAQRRLSEAAALLERLLKAAEAGGRTSRIIEILILQTFAAQSDNIERAMLSLAQALHLAKRGGYIRVFIDEGPSMASLLYEALSRGIRPDYVRRLLALFPITEPKHTAPTQKVDDTYDLIEPLSEREIEVLQHIAEGLTNPDIAAKLYLSPNTVKVHTRNIYSKLAVNNRTQAVIRAKGIGILPTD